ncbi:MAG: PIG-L family deacetylase [Chloroflexi bacterium]|nr:PIG-L family deacetylase [Chloroflexota bacterium]
MSQNNGFYVPARAQVIVAHPDDIEFSVAGTIARWTQAGCEVSYVLVTSGDVGIADESLSLEEAREMREREQRQAAQVLGVKDVVFLREPDGSVVNTLELRKKLVREIRRFRPDVLICQDPTIVFASEGYINHPDHRAAGQAALDAVFPAAGQPHVFQELAEEGLKAHKTRRVYVPTWRKEDANLYVNISATIEAKIQALFAHESQMQEIMGQRKVDLNEIEHWIRHNAAERGKGKEMAYAESFRVVVLEPDELPDAPDEG